MAMRLAAIGLAALLSACGGSGPDTATTNDPAAQNVAAAAAEGTPAVVAAATECKAKPDFVPVYGDATITLCTSGAGVQPGHESGTIVYTTSARPRTALGWSREQANASGLGQRMLTETMYSAGEASKRSLTVIVEPEGSGAKVTVNWGRDV
jgi:hypothetical protein